MNSGENNFNPQAVNDKAEENSHQQNNFCCHCGSRLKTEGKFCTNCGQSVDNGKGGNVTDTNNDCVPQSPQQPPKPQTAEVVPVFSLQQPQNIASQQVAPAGNLSCSNCGNTLPQNAKFCVECGTSVLAKAKAEYKLVSKADGNLYAFDIKSGEHVSIGKAEDCGIILSDDDYVSRTHARLYTKDGTVWLEDLNSSNGTFIRIDKPVSLKNGSQIFIGKRLLVFEKNNSN